METNFKKNIEKTTRTHIDRWKQTASEQKLNAQKRKKKKEKINKSRMLNQVAGNRYVIR